MGLPAIKAAYQSLAAELTATPHAVSQPCEVIDLTYAQAARKQADFLIGKLTAWRVSLIAAVRITEAGVKNPAGLESGAPAEVRALVAMMLVTKKNLSGESVAHLMGLHGLQEQHEREGGTSKRYLRRLIKRVLEAAEACDPQRKKLLSLIDEMVPILKRVPAFAQSEPASERGSEVDFTHIFEASLARYPVITSYLAK